MSNEPDNTHAALAALADGTLPAPQRESLLAQVAGSPELAAELADQQRAVVVVRSLERVEAPALLRRAIELAAAGDRTPAGDRQAAGSGLPPAPSPRARARRGLRAGALPRRPRLVAVGALTAAVAVVLVLALTSGGGGASPPTVLQASRVGLHASTLAAPSESRRDPHLLAVSAAGIHYPYWGGKLGWRAVGARADTVGGRTITTVFYADDRGRRIGYSIVAGGVLPIPSGSAVTQRHGIDFHVLSHADPTVVTWREAGHTCILTARGVAADTLMRLATWERA